MKRYYRELGLLDTINIRKDFSLNFVLFSCWGVYIQNSWWVLGAYTIRLYISVSFEFYRSDVPKERWYCIYFDKYCSLVLIPGNCLIMLCSIQWSGNLNTRHVANDAKDRLQSEVVVELVKMWGEINPHPFQVVASLNLLAVIVIITESDSRVCT